MNELLRQALWLTGVGMSMTFAAIGTLVLGMYLLTALARERGKEEETPQARSEPASAPAETTTEDDRYRAAAAAVAVAIAIAQTRTASETRAERGMLSPWTSHVRREQISRPRR